jgi:transposase
MGRAEVLGRERRRVWSDEDKLRILAEAGRQGIGLAAAARRHDLHPQQLYTWRRLFRRAAEAARSEEPVAFLPVEIRDPVGPSAPRPPRRRARAVEVTLVGGRRLRIDPDIDPEALRRLVQALERA